MPRRSRVEGIDVKSGAGHPMDDADPRPVGGERTDHSDSDQEIPLARTGAPVAGSPSSSSGGDPAPERGWRQLDDVLAILSHDLRNPLSALSIGIDALEEPDLDEATRTRYLAAMRRAVTRAERSLGDLVDLSRVLSGTLKIDVTATPLMPLLERVARDHEAVAQEARNYIVLESDEGVDRVLADPRRLEQVVDRVLVNALRYARGSGAITLKAERVSEPPADSVRLWVIDRGPGLPERDLDQLADVNWRDTSLRRDGAGIALAVARGAVQAMGGALRVENTPGEGTRICIELRTA